MKKREDRSSFRGRDSLHGEKKWFDGLGSLPFDLLYILGDGGHMILLNVGQQSTWSGDYLQNLL